jgi:hypothetical protein
VTGFKNHLHLAHVLIVVVLFRTFELLNIFATLLDFILYGMGCRYINPLLLGCSCLLYTHMVVLGALKSHGRTPWLGVSGFEIHLERMDVLVALVLF